MFEGSAANAAAADDADATFDDTALALNVAMGLPATMAPEDCVLDVAETPELVFGKLVLLLPLVVLFTSEALLASPEAEAPIPNVFVAPESTTEEPEADELVPTVGFWTFNEVADRRVSVKDELIALLADGVADGKPTEKKLDPVLVLESLPLFGDG